MAKLVSSTYGDALFELALEENKLDEFFDEIAMSREIFLQNEELLKLLNHPKIVKEEKLAVVEKVFRGQVSDEVLGFLHIIVTKDRYNDITDIFDYFLRRVKRHKGIGEAMVTSAIPLSKEQKAAVEKKLLETTKYTSFEMDYRIDPGIIGGLVIRIDDRVVDSSLKTQIDTLSRQLSKIQLS
ncbi:MAG: F0F1 ATP synthase subunit delta [Clostridiales bacterium]|nr:F0F1 ATP synthase subunit delta [Clostridiales bacterium]